MTASCIGPPLRDGAVDRAGWPTAASITPRNGGDQASNSAKARAMSAAAVATEPRGEPGPFDASFGPKQP